MQKARRIFITVFCGALFVVSAMAQTTTFSYQGTLNDGANPASGNYDFEFRLFDALSGGTQQGTTVTVNSVAVASGVFSVSLDFGAQFSGQGRFLDISIRTAGGPGGFTNLLPRQPVNSSPYSIKAVTADNATNATNALNATTADNALQLGGVAAGQFVVTTDSRMSDARTPVPGSSSYVQNRTTQQAGSNFNISGTGTAAVFNAGTQYNINNNRILSNPGVNNLFAGVGAGSANTTGRSNTASGSQALFSNTTGSFNTANGYRALLFNTTGEKNTANGYRALVFNTTGSFNTANGFEALFNNTTGEKNTASGFEALYSNTTGSWNTASGYRALLSNTTGFQNTASGFEALLSNTIGVNNTANGYRALRGNTTGSDNTAIGYRALLNNTTGSNNTASGFNALFSNTTGIANTAIGDRASVGSGALSFATAIGAQAVVNSSNTIQLGRNGTDVVRIGTTGAAGSTSLCLNASNEISTCSSSMRYKSNVRGFGAGLSLINKLRPVTFTWTRGGMLDVGLVAEEVAAIEPLLTVTKNGQVEGVKYNRLGVVLVNAVKEQQEQIEKQKEKVNGQNEKIVLQQKQIDQQQKLIEEQRIELEQMKVFICSQDPTLAFCRQKEQKQ